MKRHVLGAAAVLFGAAAQMTPFAWADAPAARSPIRAAKLPRNSVNADLGLSVVGLAYHRVLHPRVELQVQAQLYSPWYLTSGIAGLGAQLRSYFFVAGAAPAGVYLSPFVRATYVRGSLQGVDGTGYGWTVGAAFGQSFLLGRRVIVRGGLGLQYLVYEISSETARAAVRTFYPTVDLSIGIAF